MKKIPLWFVPCAVFILSGLSYSEEEQGSREVAATMEEVVVTATRDREEVRNIPANVSVITSEDIEDSGATNIVEVLEKLESIHFRSYSGNSSQALVDIRGFGGDNPYGKTLVMLDGRRLNRLDMSSVNWLQIPLSNIDRIEIVRGASSVLYGDSAIAGVINIITKTGKRETEADVSFIAGSYGTKDGRVSLRGSKDRLTYAVNAQAERTKGYRDRSEFSSKGGGINLGYDLSDSFHTSLGLSFTHTDSELPGSLTMAQMAANRRQVEPGAENDDLSNEYFNVDLRFESFIGENHIIEMAFLYGRKEIESNRESFWAPNQYNFADFDTFAILPKYIYVKDLSGHHNKLVMGIDSYDEKMELNKYGDRERTNHSHSVNFKRESLGYYMRDEFNISSDLVLFAGLRNEKTTIQGNQVTLATGTLDFDNEKEHKGKAYEGGLIYLFGDRDKVFAKYSTSYRYPFLDEQASYWGFGADRFFMNLEKEKAKNYELGSLFFPFKTLKLSLTVFRSDIKDEIVWNGITNRNENLDKTRHQGAEFSFTYFIEGVADLYGNFTYHEAKFMEGANMGKNIPLVPEKMGNLGLNIYLPYNLSLRTEMRYVSKSYLGNDNDNSEEQLDSYRVCDMYLSYMADKSVPGITLFLGVDNITNEEYNSSGYDGGIWLPNSFYPAPERAFRGGISFLF